MIFLAKVQYSKYKLLLDKYTAYRYSGRVVIRKKYMGIINFKNKGTEDINYGKSSKEALRILPKNFGYIRVSQLVKSI